MAAVDALDTVVVDLRALAAQDRAALLALVQRADVARDHPPLPEPQQLAVVHVAEAAHGERVVLARRGADLVGSALLTPAQDGSTVVHVGRWVMPRPITMTLVRACATSTLIVLVPPESAANSLVGTTNGP